MKSATAPSFEAELCISPELVLIMQTVAVITVILVEIGLPEPGPVLDLAVAALVVTGLTWLLISWKPPVLRGVLTAEWAIMACALYSWLQMPALSCLFAVPVVLAAALGSPHYAVVVASVESLYVGVERVTPSAVGERVGTLVAIWAVFGLTFAIYQSMSRLSGWLYKQHRQIQGQLEEARDRQVELKQALEDLAHANRQLDLLNDRIAAARLRAEEAEKTKAAFVSNVSHEFRTPLNMIIGLIDLVTETPEIYGGSLTPALLDDLEIVRRNCEHLSTMINDVLDLSRLEAKRVALHMTFTDLTQIIDQALTVVRPLIEKKGLALRVDLDPDLREVYCDATRIRQVILNLVSNAARFTEIGSITVKAIQKGNEAMVSVIDTGPGIREEEAVRIFEPFQQANASAARGLGGSGLGLSISKSFIELHGGRMWLESRVGLGSTFTFTLPITPFMGHTSPPERWIVEGWVQRGSRARPSVPFEQRVILCDETGELQPVFSGHADRIEFVDCRSVSEVAEALDGSGAQSVIVNTASSANLLQIMEQVREATCDVPVIGCCIPARNQKAREAGATSYLIKPIMRTRLLTALDGLERPLGMVLIVDDDQSAVSLLTRLLSTCYKGLEVATAFTGRQALEEMRSKRPDAVLLDIVLPDLNGWQVLAAKREDAAIRDIPVILVSAQDPHDLPLRSEIVAATVGSGLSVSKLLQTAQALAALLTKPD